jgi:hypothetical protein
MAIRKHLYVYMGFKDDKVSNSSLYEMEPHFGKKMELEQDP